MKNIYLFVLLLAMTTMFMCCKKENYEKGNLNNYYALGLKMGYSYSFYLVGDSLISIDNEPGLNYIPIEINTVNLDELELYISNYFGFSPYIITHYDIITNYDSLRIADYTEIADSSGGQMYLVNNSLSTSDTIIQILNTQIANNSNIVFLIDKTGSMTNDMDYLRAKIDEILKNIPSDSYIAAAAYGDNNYPEDWYSSMTSFTKEYTQVKTFINGIAVGGGGSNPGESVYDAIYETLNRFNWISTAPKAIIIIGDEPPLKGSETNHSLEEVIDLCKSKSGGVKLYPILIR